jgi:DNA-binding YbaB/EbfC family protein
MVGRRNRRTAATAALSFEEAPASMKIPDIAAMMKQAQAMQSKMQEVQDEVGQKTVEASSGGGVVTVTANGKGEVLSIKIDPSLIKDGDVEMLEDLVLAAVNEAHRRAEEMMKSALSRIAGPLAGGLPF